jgi:hypothetical protein
MLWLLARYFPPALACFFWWSWRKRQQLIARFIQARLLPDAARRASRRCDRKIRLGCIIAAVICHSFFAPRQAAVEGFDGRK